MKIDCNTNRMKIVEESLRGDENEKLIGLKMRVGQVEISRSEDPNHSKNPLKKPKSNFETKVKVF